jgi:hypothetical protein
MPLKALRLRFLHSGELGEEIKARLLTIISGSMRSRVVFRRGRRLLRVGRVVGSIVHLASTVLHTSQRPICGSGSGTEGAGSDPGVK